VHPLVPLCLLGATTLAGCDRAYRTREIDDEMPAANVWMVRTLSDESVENAVIAQHTIYPYHFVRDSAELTAVGQRDARVLGRHFARHPGELSMQRGDAPDELYQRRTASVMEALQREGVNPETIRRGGGMPGGDGVETNRAVAVLRIGNQPRGTGAGSDTRSDDAQGATSNEIGGNR
jgi:hypothetical protein